MASMVGAASRSGLAWPSRASSDGDQSLQHVGKGVAQGEAAARICSMRCG
jgi:hypothetical protein